MPVDVQGAGQFRRGLQPVSGQQPSPFLRAVIETQGGQLAPQTTDFGNAVQPQQLAQLTGGLVLQLLDGLDAAQRHVGQQDDHVQRAVVAAQLNKAIVEMSKQAILRQGRQVQSTPPKETSRQGSKWVGAPSRRPNAARTRWSGRVHAVPISAAASSTARVDLSVAMGGWRAAALYGGNPSMACAADRSVAMGGWRAAALSGAVAPGSRGPGSVSRPCWSRLAERVEFKAQVLGDFSSAPTNPQQLLCLGGDLRRHHRSTACRTRCVKRFHAPGAILVDATNDAVLRDAEGPHDIDLAARTHADQLGGEHLKSAAFVLGMLKQGLSAAEVDPLAILRTTLIKSLMRVAPSGISGNNAWGMVSSSW